MNEITFNAFQFKKIIYSMELNKKYQKNLKSNIYQTLTMTVVL